MITNSWGLGRRTRLAILSVGFVILLLASMLLAALGVSAQTPAPWRGEYYNNPHLSGSPALVRMDNAIDFNWGDNSPGSGINTGYFSVRWTAYVYLDAATYTFNVTTDDGARLWVDDELILDEWRDQAKKSFSAAKTLGAGYHSLRLEYYDGGEQAVIMLNWMPGSSSPAPMPGPEYGPGPGHGPGPDFGPGAGLVAGEDVLPDTEPFLEPAPKPAPQQVITVDETDPGFAWGGTHGSFYSRGMGFRDHLYWTWNNDVKRFNWGKWSPNIPTAGNWEVQAYVADRYFGTTQATYEIMHSGMRDRRTVNQAGYRNQWVSLGTYRFSGGGDEYVLLSDMTGEPYGTRYVGFDAVRFVSSGGGERPGLKPQPRSQPKPEFYCCYIMPVLGFGRVWNSYPAVRNGLRCPTEPEKGTWLAEKQTKDGLEFLRQDIGQALVLKNNGTWQSYADGWAGLQPAFGPPAAPPQGMHKPGGSWKGWPHQAAMGGRGWPAMGPRFAQATVQQFEGGSMLWSSTRGIYVLYANGRWSRYD